MVFRFFEIQNSSGNRFSVEYISVPGVKALERKKLNLVVNLRLSDTKSLPSNIVLLFLLFSDH